jgi:hypothetical protein
MEAIGIAVQVYLIAFVVALGISFIIKGLLSVITRITPKPKKEIIKE